jgi:uncharacterized protein YndB with AHSA1/START domain
VKPVRFPVSAEVAFDYLVDPRRRAEWQASLVRVEQVHGEPRVGQRWLDVTRPGLRPRMETTELQRPHRWTERGAWRGLTATLTLAFAPAEGGCDVGVVTRVDGRGAWKALAPGVRAAAPYGVRSDLRRAARRLSQRS